MRKKYLVLLLVMSLLTLTGCGKKKPFAPPPVPFAPSDLRAEVISATEIKLTWQVNSSIEKGFFVYRKTTDNYARVATMEKEAWNYNDTGLMSETTYWYKVSAYNDQGESARSNEVSVTTPREPPPPPEPLEPPSNVMAEAVSYKQINLSWQDNSDDEDHFRIACDMGLGDGHNQFLVRLPANTTQYEHCNLQPMRHYRYFVIAERSGEEAGSERFGATTFAAPVEILEYWLARSSMRMFHLGGKLKNAATEPCSVELTAEYHITCTWSGFEEWDTCIYTVDLEALADNTFFEFLYILQTESAGDKWVECTLEITDVEIEY